MKKRYASTAGLSLAALRGFGALAAACVLLAAEPVQAQQLDLTTAVLDVPGASVPAGDTFRYRVSYSCNIASPPPNDCDGVTVEVDLPPEVAYVSAFFPPGDVQGASHDGSPQGGTVTFTFSPNIPPGNSGDLDITVRFPNGSTPDGTTTTVTPGEVRSSGVALNPVATELPQVRASASVQVDVSVALLDNYLDSCQTGPGNEPSIYRVTLSPSTASGSLDWDEIPQVVLVLPAGVDTVVPLNGGVEGPTGTITWSNLGPLSVGNQITLDVQLNFPSTQFSDGQQVSVQVSGQVDPIDLPPPVVNPVSFGPSTFNHQVNAFRYTTGAAVTLGYGQGRPNSLPPGVNQPFTYELTVANTGSVDFDSLVLTADGDGAGGVLSPDLAITSVTTGAYAGVSGGTVTLTITTDVTNHVLTSSVFTDQSLAVPGGEQVQLITWTFSAPIAAGMTTATRPTISLSATSATAQSIFAHADWTASPPPNPCGGTDPPSSGSDGTSHSFTPAASGYVYLRPQKVETSTGPYLPNDTISYRLNVTNDSLAQSTASTVVVADLLPSVLAPQSGYTLTDNGTGVSVATFETIANYNGTGRTLLRWTLTGSLDPGETVSIDFSTVLSVGVIFGGLANEVALTTPPSSTTQYCAVGAQSGTADVFDLDGDTDTTDMNCTASTTVQVAAVAQLRSEKFVKGQCDAGFIGASSGTGMGQPSGTVDWRIEVQNLQTVPIGNLVIIDIFPAIGDTGVVDTSSRNSQFTPLLVAPIQPPPGGQVEYSTSMNPCRGEVGGPTTGCDANAFSPTPPMPITDTRSIRVSFGSLVLNPLDTLSFEWSMTLPADTPTTGQLAYNSFAYGGTRQDDGGLLSAEPLKVGVDGTCSFGPTGVILGDRVWLDADADGVQNDPTTSTLVNGVTATLYDVGGDGEPRSGDDVMVLQTVTADDAGGTPGWYEFSFPLSSPQTYYVCFDLPPTLSPTTKDSASGTEATDSDVYALNGCTDPVTLNPGDAYPDLDLGVVQTGLAAVGDYVWNDRNSNGLQDEPTLEGVNGVRVELYADDGDGVAEPNADDGPFLRATVTADDQFGRPGFYLFDDLQPGVPYFLLFIRPAAATGFTSRNAGSDDSRDSDVRSDGRSPVFTLAVGEIDRSIDAGLVFPQGQLALGNVVWLDNDADGLYQTGGTDQGVAGVRLDLYADVNGNGQPETDEYVMATQTASLAGRQGRYQFSGLAAGRYIVVVSPSNFVFGAPLWSYVPTTPGGSADDDVDHDSNGQTFVSLVRSDAVILATGAEPVIDAEDDGSNDDNSNFAVDFGFTIGVPLAFDFGDAPDLGPGTGRGNYATSVLDNGASQPLPVVPDYGACADADSGLSLRRMALDDDVREGEGGMFAGSCAVPGDDEDGVTISGGPLRPGGTFDVTLSGGGALPTMLMWIDWNQNGSFEDAGEQVATFGAYGTQTITVPATAVPGVTYMRIRPQGGGNTSTGADAVNDGEVEDYRLVIQGMDYGDAPDLYGTTAASSGASHWVDPDQGLYLGTCVDTEADGQPGVSADGDDLAVSTNRIGDCVSDERGVTFDSLLIRGNTATLTVTASKAGILDAWIDFRPSDGDGFAAAMDQVAASMPLVQGPNTFSIAVPATAEPGLTYARFRFSSAGGLSPTGGAADGEVEDYLVRIHGIDFGDLPSPTYPTLLADGGAQHVVVPGSNLHLGSCADVDNDGAPSAGADGDDLASSLSAGGDDGNCLGSPDDEDGVTFTSTLAACQTAVVTVNAAAAGRLDGWIDFSPFVTPGFDPGDQVVTNLLLSPGANTVTFTVPCWADVDTTTYARFRFSSTGGLSPTGLAGDGEVEDYTVYLGGTDYGDAPDSFATLRSSSGPSHSVDLRAGREFLLGACVDVEADGAPSTGATGDDTTAGLATSGTCAVGNDDEDGVTFTGGSSIVACTTGNTLEVTLLNNAGLSSAYLDAWIDWNGDGAFQNSGEHLFGGTSQSLSAGTNTLSFDAPCTAVAQTQAVARFRLSSVGGALPTGELLDGEVEDYTVEIRGVDYGDAPDTFGTTLASTPGPAHHAILGGYMLGSAIDDESDGQPSSNALGDDSGGVDDEDGVTFSGAALSACSPVNQVTIQLTNTAGVGTSFVDGWADWNGDGTFQDPQEHLFGGTSQSLATGSNQLNFSVPCDAVVQASMVTRFRLSSTGGLAPTDGAGPPVADGEVEDYAIELRGVDYGDAPDTYATSLSSPLGRASHTVIPGYSLGFTVDTENDGAPGASAAGDGGDEDGPGFVAGYRGATACTTGNTFTMRLTNTAGLPSAYLDAWIDFNGNGTFDHPGEHIFGGTSQTLVAGVNSLTYDVPCNAVPQTVSYVRYRLSSGGSLAPYEAPSANPAPDGEVEDFTFEIRGVDYGDAPDTFGTTIASAAGPASHTILPGLSLGTLIDNDVDGIPSAGADGDDLLLTDDEDGVTLPAALLACSPNQIDVVVTNTAGVATLFLDAWVDWDGDGSFDQPAEHLFGGTSQALTAGSNSFTINAPCTAVDQAQGYARFRLSSGGGLNPTNGPGGNPAADGEVEDYTVVIRGVDFGDAPDSYGTTLASGPGDASHIIIPGYSLGWVIDRESDGQPTAAADGDDAVDSDDEDGIYFPLGQAVVAACTTGNRLSVVLTNTAGLPGAYLDAWMDWNGNGTFDHPAEHLFGGTSALLQPGETVVTYDVPCDARDQATSYARFRLSVAGSLSPTDGAGTPPVTEGEVEDYTVEIQGVDYGDAPDSYGTTIASTEGKASHTIVRGFSLGLLNDTEADGQPQTGALGDDSDAEGDDEDGVTFTSGTTLIPCTTDNRMTVVLSKPMEITNAYLDAWVDWNGNGRFDHPEEHLFNGISRGIDGGSNIVTYQVPCTAAAQQQTYARFRLSEQGGLTPNEAGSTPIPTGEVEDYALAIQGVDFGDAPDTYGTTVAAGSGAARHVIVFGYELGSTIDSESDGQPSAAADGDDTAGTNDEDGVTIQGGSLTFETCSTGNSILVELTNTAGVPAAFLDGWIDWDGNGSFDHPAEHIFGGTSVGLTTGMNTVSFDVPCTAHHQATTYARFRLSSAGGLAPTDGPGAPAQADGEVEDYTVTLIGRDYGDAPDSYATTLASGGPYHTLPEGTNVYLGSCVDAEDDARTPLDGTGDDGSAGLGQQGVCQAGDDEDGVVFDTPIVPCQSASVTVTASASARLDGWIDFDRDGGFLEAADQIITDQPITGTQTFSFTVPCTVSIGDSYARFRISSAGGLGPAGAAADGEVEDYPLLLAVYDYGDAPDPTYPTLEASGGARHVLGSGIYLGSCVDAETDGVQSPDATGDDVRAGLVTFGTCTGTGDEDGVGLPSQFYPGFDASLTVTASAACTLRGWIDFNGDGDWDDPGEDLFPGGTALTAGANPVTVVVPSTAAEGTTFARFRCSSDGTIGPSGTALDGEVEDYQVSIAPTGEVCGAVYAFCSTAGQIQRAGDLAGVTVKAYDENTLVATATTGTDGTYSLTTPGQGTFRVEFEGLPAGYVPSTLDGNPGTTVRFIEARGSCTADLGLMDPTCYCESGADVATACYVFGDQIQAGPMDTVVTVPYGAGSNATTADPSYDEPFHGLVATAEQVGTVWGLAWHRASQSLFAGAFTKRHSGFGPGGPGAIYRMDRATGAVTTFVDVEQLAPGSSGGDSHDAADYFHDATVWDAVGRTAFGDLEISTDGSTLWAMNLFDRQVYEIPLSNLPNPPSNSEIRTHLVPMDQADCPDPVTDIRPFGLGWHGAKLYVGLVCSAESTGSAADLRGYVYSYDPSSGVWIQELNTDLGYSRGCANKAYDATCQSDSPAAWNPWLSSPLHSRTYETHPQPLLADIDFDGDVMVLGLRDRFGDQRGSAAGNTNPSDKNLFWGIPAGDVLRACRSGSGPWELESNGSCGGVTTAGADNGQGPGGGEFFYQDQYAMYGPAETLPRHDEIALGGLAVLPGFSGVVTSAFDPIPVESEDTFFDGGLIWLNKETGARERSYRLFNGSRFEAGAGKANGIGDIEFLCSMPSAQIGNRVWQDTDGDGLQDPGEVGIPGVRLELWSLQTSTGAVRIAVTTTDGLGTYRFDGSNTTASLAPNVAYEVRVDTSSGPISQATLSPANQGSHDGIDSDGVDSGGVISATVTIGSEGAFDDSVDFGFTGAVTAVPFGATWAIAVSLGLVALLLLRRSRF